LYPDSTGLLIPVKPLTKYWLIVHRVALTTATGYTRWYLDNSTTVNARLTGTNPANATLYMKYSADGVNWLVDTGYFLTFEIDETLAFEAEGSASRIIDYGKSQKFVSINYDVANVDAGVFSLTFNLQVMVRYGALSNQT
jgi:hypothetical protein